MGTETPEAGMEPVGCSNPPQVPAVEETQPWTLAKGSKPEGRSKNIRGLICKGPGHPSPERTEDHPHIKCQ